MSDDPTYNLSEVCFEADPNESTTDDVSSQTADELASEFAQSLAFPWRQSCDGQPVADLASTMELSFENRTVAVTSLASPRLVPLSKIGVPSGSLLLSMTVSLMVHGVIFGSGMYLFDVRFTAPTAPLVERASGVSELVETDQRSIFDATPIADALPPMQVPDATTASPPTSAMPAAASDVWQTPAPLQPSTSLLMQPDIAPLVGLAETTSAVATPPRPTTKSSPPALASSPNPARPPAVTPAPAESATPADSSGALVAGSAAKLQPESPLAHPSRSAKLPTAPRPAPRGRGKAPRNGYDGRGMPIPDYPSESRRRGEEGLVVLEVEVLNDGSVGRVSIATDSGHARLNDAAIEAAREPTFTPALLDGKALASRIRIPFRFVLH